MKRPKFNRVEKVANREAIAKNRKRISKATKRIVENTPYHWTLIFANKRRLELYPSMLGLHNVGRKLRYYKLEKLLAEIERFAALPPETQQVEAAE